MDEQRKVSTFIEAHNLEAPPEFRLLDLVSEVGELAKDATESTGYGDTPDTLSIESDEVGDVLFALLALSHSLDIDVSDAVDEALDKYDDRIATSGDPGSSD